MKFILDANIPYSAKELFKRPYEVVHVRDVGLTHAGDEEIIVYSLRERAIVITRDMDFANIILHPIESHAGAVVLRFPSFFTAKQIKKFLARFLLMVDIDLLLNSITIVEPSRYRIRSKQ
ncbi:MAG: hypothetical protein G01um101470_20 [Parcubacteria group bacterium Gr01-1014_70]|nr:MAG: hypothetical protein G01um101470_20 [Parcubacteria group bacterium Gr01-1014_70]